MACSIPGGYEVSKVFPYHPERCDECDDQHSSTAAGAGEGVDLVDAANQQRESVPEGTQVGVGFGLRHARLPYPGLSCRASDLGFSMLMRAQQMNGLGLGGEGLTRRRLVRPTGAPAGLHVKPRLMTEFNARVGANNEVGPVPSATAPLAPTV